MTGSQPQMWFGRQRGAPLTVNGVNANLKSGVPPSGVTSSSGSATLSSSMSDHVCAFGPVRLVGRRGQPARRGEVLVAERAAVRGAEVVVEDVAQ